MKCHLLNLHSEKMPLKCNFLENNNRSGLFTYCRFIHPLKTFLPLERENICQTEPPICQLIHLHRVKLTFIKGCIYPPWLHSHASLSSRKTKLDLLQRTWDRPSAGRRGCCSVADHDLWPPCRGGDGAKRRISPQGSNSILKRKEKAPSLTYMSLKITSNSTPTLREKNIDTNPFPQGRIVTTSQHSASLLASSYLHCGNNGKVWHYSRLKSSPQNDWQMNHAPHRSSTEDS